MTVIQSQQNHGLFVPTTHDDDDKCPFYVLWEDVYYPNVDNCFVVTPNVSLFLKMFLCCCGGGYRCLCPLVTHLLTVSHLVYFAKPTKIDKDETKTHKRKYVHCPYVQPTYEMGVRKCKHHTDENRRCEFLHKRGYVMLVC
jgi:hypothetical protein